MPAYKELNNTISASYIDLKSMQNKRLKQLLAHAYHTVSYYKNNYSLYLKDIARIPEDEMAELMRTLPVLSKSTILENPEHFLSNQNFKTHTNISSGTTGQPFAYPCDQVSWAYRHASIMRCLEMHGVLFGSPYGYFFGQHWKNELKWKTLAKDVFFNRIRFSAFDITVEAASLAYKKFKQKKVVYFFGYPSTMVEFCKICTEILAIDLKSLELKVVMATGETLENFQKDYLTRVLGCRVVNYYGSAEGGAGAFEGPEGWMHENMETTHVEISDSGKIVKTDLFLRQFPMLKIVTDDICIPAPEGAKSVLGHRILGNITGRTGEKIRLPDGREYHAVILDYFFDLFINHPEVLRFRFEFHKDHVLLNIHNNRGGITNEFAASLANEFGRLFGNVRFSIKHVEEIKQLPNGKHRPWVQIN